MTYSCLHSVCRCWKRFLFFKAQIFKCRRVVVWHWWIFCCSDRFTSAGSIYIFCKCSVRHTLQGLELFHQPTLMHNFLYSLTIYLLHYYPRHVSSINMPIFRRQNYIHTASGIFALCKLLHSTLVESGLTCQSALNQCTWHVNARNMSRILV